MHDCITFQKKHTCYSEKMCTYFLADCDSPCEALRENETPLLSTGPSQGLSHSTLTHTVNRVNTCIPAFRACWIRIACENRARKNAQKSANKHRERQFARVLTPRTDRMKVENPNYHYDDVEVTPQPLRTAAPIAAAPDMVGTESVVEVKEEKTVMELRKMELCKVPTIGSITGTSPARRRSTEEVYRYLTPLCGAAATAAR